MGKFLKTRTLKRSASRTEIRSTNLAAMEITVDQQDDNHEVHDWPVRGYFCENEIVWAMCCGVCTDGGIVAPHVAWSHCCIHRQSFAAKPLPES
ncbi:hypothetical protein AVEN_136237-1 [Araneus ventricosus]|uniref:Uncharacterized protein n=1 Tax=Araneus ventricosus TaxID=182803 RepID=A0A4Y2QKE9_ARAVE|nr:hypothetical protein AVEN_171808-1 [Araneus ventricosus]GBN63679.1 hypothetical protein AVEN_136237-1 [Araneus ventricosus]